MKKLLQYSLVVFICMVLWGCPYESSIALDEPTVKLDAQLLGKWCSVSDKKCTDMATISMLDDYRYKIETGSIKTKNYETYVAWISIIDGYTYLNLQNNINNQVKYNFLLVTELTRNRLIYKTIKEADKTPFANSAELRRWVSDNSMNIGFYEDGDTLLRCKMK